MSDDRYYITNTKWDGVRVNYRHLPDQRANIAIEIVKHCALIAAREHGEDSAGRQALVLQSAKEVANRAVDIAKAIWARFESEGMLIELPEPKATEE